MKIVVTWQSRILQILCGVSAFSLFCSVTCFGDTKNCEAGLGHHWGVQALLRQHRRHWAISTSKTKQYFLGVSKRTVYNPTKPIQFDGKRILFGRVESLDSETDSQVVAFYQSGVDQWSREESFSPLHLQDPFVAVISGKLILGGVEFIPDIGYRTIFHQGTNLTDLRRVAEGPWGMKDIRLIELSPNKILVMTRPQGIVNGYDAGPGKIGWTMISNVNELNDSTITKAKVIEELFSLGEWGSSNELHLLDDGRVGVVGHIARWLDEGNKKNRHYYPFSFIFDPKDGQISNVKLLLERANLENGLNGTTKPLNGDFDNLRDVLFSGGLEHSSEGRYYLWLGAGDAEVHRIQIPFPFLTKKR